MRISNSTTARWMRYGLAAGIALSLAAAGHAADQGVVIAPDEASIAATLAYWTPERMESAAPMPFPEVPADGETSLAPPPDDAVPGVAPGWAPGSGPQPDATTAFWQGEDAFLDSLVANLEEPLHGPAPTNPKDGPYPPFQRWTWFGNYLTYPTSTVGKLFFTLPGIGNFVCSASVVGRSTLATAGHCVSSGTGIWATNMMFCPSYFRASGPPGAPHPQRGCWAGVTQATSSAWHNSRDFNRDYGCIVTATTGTVVANKVGNVTGWTGRSWNWPARQPMISMGYPQGSPFGGYHIVTAASSEWYTNGGGPQNAKYIGNDMTGGSSGGPWWFGLRHRSFEYSDTDGNNNTDPLQPGGPYINGVNSHKRCAVHCGSPPTPTAGVFWQEMGSPAFRNTTGDGGESEDVFALCLAHNNND